MVKATKGTKFANNDLIEKLVHGSLKFRLVQRKKQKKGEFVIRD